MEFNQNTSFSGSVLERNLGRNPIDIDLDLDLIDSDLEKLLAEDESYVTDWIENLPSNITGKGILNGNEPAIKCEDGEEIEFLSAKEKKVGAINLSRYISIKEGNVYIDCNYTSLFEGMALELLGEDLVVNAEETLKGLNSLESYDSKILIENGWIDINFLEKARKKRARYSEYFLKDGFGHTYFYDMARAPLNTFGCMIDDSLEKLKLIVLSEVLGGSKVVTFLGFNETGMSLLVDTRDEKKYNETIKLLRKKVGLRIFGRKFCFSPVITIVEV